MRRRFRHLSAERPILHFLKSATTAWLLALATVQFISECAIGAEAMHWGQPVSGIRAGVAITVGKSGPELSVDFQNIGSRTSSLQIARWANTDGGYDFSTWAVAPEGTSVQSNCNSGASFRVEFSRFLFRADSSSKFLLVEPTRLRNQ